MNVVKVTGPDLNNGNGTRVTCWISGCKHNCKGCHNKWLQDYNEGKPLCNFKEKIFQYLNLPYINGVTFSGGDPLYQDIESLNELKDFIIEIRAKYPTKDIWIYSGFTLKEVTEKQYEEEFFRKVLSVLNQCDYFVDGKFDKTLKDVRLPFRGSSNQKIWKKEFNGWCEVNDKIFKN